MTNVQERVPTAALALSTGASQNMLNTSAGGTSRAAMVRSSDLIRRIGPQYAGTPIDSPPGGGGGAGYGGGIVQQLLGIIQQLLSALGFGGMFGGLGGFSGNGNTAQGPETYFQNANGASVGDPHLSFDGTTSSGVNDQSHFDSMVGQSDLLDSDSFTGGYQISTNVTQPAVNGVTYNQQATITTGYGGTEVSLDNSGNAFIEQNGQMIALGNGQSYNLGDGETVMRNTDGSLVVSDNDGMGGTITTTLRDNGQGVDVSAQADNVDLGGDLVNQSSPAPVPGPVGGPVFQPWQQY